MRECVGAADGDLYLGKFHTKHNLTEWYFQSDAPSQHETAVGVLYSPGLDLVLVAVVVQGNTYLNVTLELAGQDHRNQTNLAILAFHR
jgi:hypothetical protein